jgi:hypothetical protein
MGQFLRGVTRRCLELLFHWTAAGIILTVWGVTPEHVIEAIFRNAPAWVSNQVVRLPFALAGLGLIVWNIFLRTHRPLEDRQSRSYKITHNSDETSDVEAFVTFPYSPAQFRIKFRLPEFREKPRIRFFPVEGNDSQEPGYEADVDNFVVQISSVSPQRAKRTWKWVAHGTLVNKNLHEFLP